MKTYKANNKIYTSLIDLKKALNADVSKCFYPGVHTINGIKVITY